tara:strand:+ start:69 stop:566 length:498 start_codon:yes stop_codon:yes gene_type:complete
MNFKEWLLEVDPNNEVIGEIPYKDVAHLLTPTQKVNPYTQKTYDDWPGDQRGAGRYLKVPFNGDQIEIKLTKQLKSIMRNGSRCVKCGRAGTRFKLLRNGIHSPVRLALFTQDDRQLTIDHIVPRGHGGVSSVNSDNVQVMCEPCNAEKGSAYVGIWPTPDPDMQ